MEKTHRFLVFLRNMKKKKLRRSYQMKKSFSIIVVIVVWLDSWAFSLFILKKINLQIAILEKTHRFLVLLRKMKENKLKRSYQMNMNHYLYPKNYL